MEVAVMPWEIARKFVPCCDSLKTFCGELLKDGEDE
jgi:hypothetical protein